MQVIHGNSFFSLVTSSQYSHIALLSFTSFLFGLLVCYTFIKYFRIESNTESGILQQAETIDFDAEHVQEQELSFTAHQIKSVIKNLVNSQYVLKDKDRYHSLFQTPLRQSIHKLRIISESLLAKQPLALSVSPANPEDKCNDLGSVILKQLNAAKKIINQDKVSIEYKDLTKTNVSVNLSQDWLSNAVQELMFNSIKHNSKKIDLAITTSIFENHSSKSVEKFLILSVIDNGKGFPRAISEKFTDKSMHVNALYRRQSDKENLVNLSLIQEKLIQIGGKLLVKSARHFRSQVDLWIPIRQSNNESTDENQLPLSNVEINKISTKSATSRLLWVSEECTQDNLIKHTLNKHYVLQMATSIEQGFTFVPTFKPDCILVDSDARLANGMIAKKWMHESGTFSDIPVISLGGLLDKSSQITALQVGVSAVIEKPIVCSELTSVINHVINEKVRLGQRVEEVIALYHSNSIENIELKNGPANRFFEQFNALLEEHFHDDAFRIANAADMLHTTDKTLSRKLAKYYNLGFCDLLKKYRLNRAKELIVSGERISNVAYDTGFSSPSYFTQCFRAEFGFAPSMLSKT